MLDYRLDGDLRFISHHDTLRLFRRALARAEIPVRFTGGFNPHPRIMIPLPRPVGVASEAESLVMETESPIDAAEAMRCLGDQLPRGLEMLAARRLARDERIQPETARYRLAWEDDRPADLDERIERIMESDAVAIERTHATTGKRRSLNIRPYIVRIQPIECELEMTLRVTNRGTVRPAEVAGLLGCDPRAVNHRIRRVAVEWSFTEA